jgi:phage recombination protein Bet
MSNSVVALQTQNWTPEQLKLITDTVAKGATKNELDLFLYRCRNMGLDPLKPGQIHFVKYGQGPGSVVIGIEGFRAIAGRTGKLSGIKRGALKDESGKLVGAWAEVFRSDWQHSAREEVPLSEYNKGSGTWAKMPETMIKKVAEAAALRMAFPDVLGGVYTQEEMDQAEPNKFAMKNMQPEEGDGCSDYFFPAIAGKLAMKRISDCETSDLIKLVEAIEGRYKDKTIPPKTNDMYQKATQEILAREGIESLVEEEVS